MNPPSAIHGAMGRERKPFTYTPGGLDLSEIKSERMAKRLMRNAMNQGVPELPPQPVQSSTTPTTPIPVPNFNALPVQVFPTFNLPANPKSLLRPRSTIDMPREPLDPKIPPTQNTNISKPSGMDQLRETLSSNTPAYTPVNNNSMNNSKSVQSYQYKNNRPLSMYEFSAATCVAPNLATTTYGSDAYTSPVLPEIRYDAEICQYPPKLNNRVENIQQEVPKSHAFDFNLQNNQNEDTNKTDFTVNPYTESLAALAPETKTVVIEDKDETDIDYQTVKVVKKQVKKAEKKVECEAQNQNGDQNGESEAEMTVKLPTKKSAAKTETKVEVVKKTLPDGSIEETKTTITKTTVDGKTNITTKTETQIIPKVEEEVEEVEEEEEEEEEDEVVVEEVEENEEKEQEPTTVVVKKTVTQETPEVKETVVKKSETSETTTTKKVIVVQNENEAEEEVVEEKSEPEQTTVIIKKSEDTALKQEEKQEVKREQKTDVKHEEAEEEEEEEEEEVVEIKDQKTVTQPEPTKIAEPEPEEEEEVEEEEEYEEAEEPEEKPEPKLESKPEPKPEPKPELKPEKAAEPEPSKEKEAEEDSEYTEEEVESEKEDGPKPQAAPSTASETAPTIAPAPTPASDAPIVEPTKFEAKLEGKEETLIKPPLPQQAAESVPQPAPQSEHKVPLREPSIPLEKVEDVEIKPIGAVSETISKSHTEKTEIISGVPDRSAGTLSTQTEYNKIENIVTVNRTTKTLDNSYEQITQQGIPTVRTYFAPGRERVSPTPQPARPYQSMYTPPQPQPQIERRHSLLLERLSTERQMPSDIYQKQTSYQQQYNNQSYEQQRQWSQEPQSEVVNDSNVKPSKIANQQWYQQSRKENVIYNNVTPSTPAVPSQQWSQPPPQHQPQPQVQVQSQIPYQQPYEIYTDNSLHDSSKFTSNSYQQNSYPSYTAAPNNWASSNVGSTLSNVNNSQTNQCSYLNKTSSESYQNTSQQYSSSYVPPPWEQDPTYVAPQLPTQTYYQPEQPSTNNTFSSTTKPGWKPTPPAGKFSKPVPKSYIPPAPNQSFVKSPAPEPLIRPGSKTYYSEYERRYITVPESTYIPSDAKFQAQPDPSPQYYYDNNEPSEAVEHQWRKELREFTEKTQTTQTQQTTTQTQQSTQQITEQSSVHPPWEEDSKYAKVPTVTYTPTPSWNQTNRPQSYCERSFESEYVGSNEWSKTKTLGRNRPLSTYGNSNVESSIPERPRGVSVDRYNPNKYQPPLTIPYDSEHGPVQAHTLDPTPSPHRGYHNPNVPAYHARASAEPREHQQTTGQARNWGLEPRATPLQSRSFKYLQWITGTED